MILALYKEKKRKDYLLWYDTENKLVGKLIGYKFIFFSEGFKKRVIRHCMINQIKLIEITENTATISPRGLKKLHELSGN